MNIFELPPGIVKVRVDLERRLKLPLGLLAPAHDLEYFAELIMGHVVVRAEGKPLPVERGRFPGLSGLLGLLKVLKGAVAVPPFSLFSLLGRCQLFDLPPLARYLLLLHADLLLLLANLLGGARPKKNRQ